MDASTINHALQIVLAALTLGAVLFGLFTGTRYSAMTDFDALPIVLLVIGLIATVVSTIVLCCGGPFLIAVGLFLGAFFAGIGIGMQVNERGS